MITIRSVEKEDIGELVKIETECFSVPWSEKSFFDALYLENTIFLAAEQIAEETDGVVGTESFENKAADMGMSENRKIVGYCGLYQSVDEGEITNVAVTEKFRGRQVAGRLLQKMLLEAVKRGISKIFLEVRVSNVPAIQLYQKYGFTTCGRRRGFYEKPKEDAWLMVWEENKC